MTPDTLDRIEADYQQVIREQAARIQALEISVRTRDDVIDRLIDKDERNRGRIKRLKARMKLGATASFNN